MSIWNDAHGLRVKGSYFIERVVFIAGVKLVFRNPAYNSIFVDIIEFKSRADERYIPGHAKNYEELVQYQTWHITKGLKPECVYFLMSKDELGTVELMEHVCGLSWYLS